MALRHTRTPLPLLLLLLLMISHEGQLLRLRPVCRHWRHPAHWPMAGATLGSARPTTYRPGAGRLGDLQYGHRQLRRLATAVGAGAHGATRALRHHSPPHVHQPAAVYAATGIE